MPNVGNDEYTGGSSVGLVCSLFVYLCASLTGIAGCSHNVTTP